MLLRLISYEMILMLSQVYDYEFAPARAHFFSLLMPLYSPPCDRGVTVILLLAFYCLHSVAQVVRAAES